MGDYQRLPVISRWMLLALGSVVEGPVGWALDPVAGWVLREHPSLLPSVPAPALLCTIRARTDVVDRMLAGAVEVAARQERKLHYWTFGAGFDARWLRMRSLLEPAVTGHTEVDVPEVMRFKDSLLDTSPFAQSWSEVERRALDEAKWALTPHEGTTPLVVLEALAGRWDSGALRSFMQRLAREAPDAVVVASVPGWADGDRERWSVRSLGAVGWDVVEDTRVGPRGRLMAPSGDEICPGMYPFRVVLLRTLQA